MMDQNRRGEIALAIVKALARREGPENLLRLLGKLDKVAEATGVELDEIRTFTELLVKDLVTDFFAENAE